MLLVLSATCTRERGGDRQTKRNRETDRQKETQREAEREGACPTINDLTHKN